MPSPLLLIQNQRPRLEAMDERGIKGRIRPKYIPHRAVFPIADGPASLVRS
jgi:hypothetical protein